MDSSPLKFYVGVTDNNWYDYLKAKKPEEINFWKPGENSVFQAISPGEPFLLKLRSPRNAIAGIGFYSSFSKLPIGFAWDVFGQNNGCNSFEDLRRIILNLRSDRTNKTPIIGCVILTNPIFFEPEDWISVSDSWSNSIVQGKSYLTSEPSGALLWSKVRSVLNKYLYSINSDVIENQLTQVSHNSPSYGESILQKVRLGQGAFRLMVTEAYAKKCSITGEKTLPVLEAAHIRSFSQDGPHLVSNSLLLRSDLHKLFDSGYITITKEYNIEVSPKIREEFENGREYYNFHGNKLLYLPANNINKPHERFIDWHNLNIYKS